MMYDQILAVWVLILALFAVALAVDAWRGR